MISVPSIYSALPPTPNVSHIFSVQWSLVSSQNHRNAQRQHPFSLNEYPLATWRLKPCSHRNGINYYRLRHVKTGKDHCATHPFDHLIDVLPSRCGYTP